MRIKETAINAVQFFKSVCFHHADWKIQEHLPVFPCDFLKFSSISCSFKKEFTSIKKKSSIVLEEFYRCCQYDNVR